jgi:hypothetical protein
MYDECKIKLLPFIDIAPKYVSLFKKIVVARTKNPQQNDSYPLYGCVAESGIIDKKKENNNSLDIVCEHLVFLLRTVFENDQTLQNFINGEEFKLSEQMLKNDSEVDKSDSLKQLQSSTLLSKISSSITKGGGLNFEFTGNENFVNKDTFYLVFDVNKRKVLSQNQREFVSKGEPSSSSINNIFNDNFLTLFGNIANQDLRTAFILFLYKFYKVSPEDISKLIETLKKDNKFLIQLDALKDIIAVHDADIRSELESQATIREKQLEKNKPPTTPEKPKGNKSFSFSFGKNKQAENKDNVATGGNTSSEKSDNNDENKKSEENSAAQNKSTDKAMAEGALSNLRTMFNNIKNKSTPVKSITPEQENQEGGANDNIYYAKYLKYKKKYMELQSRSNI